MFQLPRQKILSKLVELKHVEETDDTHRLLDELGVNLPLFVIMMLAENLGMWNGLTDFHQTVSAEEEAFIILQFVYYIFCLTLAD